MLNRNYKLGSRWKLALLLPLTVIAFFIMSCTDKDAPIKPIETAEDLAAEVSSAQIAPEEIFLVVEEMPSFNGGEPVEFRKYIAQNLFYPREAIDQGVTGKIFIKFIVSKEGKVIIPDQETLSMVEGKPQGEVVVVAYRTLSEDAAQPDEKYIKLLQEEVVRVVSSSPDWEPGKQRGTAVNVMFTFPVTFALQ